MSRTLTSSDEQAIRTAARLLRKGKALGLASELERLVESKPKSISGKFHERWLQNGSREPTKDQLREITKLLLKVSRQREAIERFESEAFRSMVLAGGMDRVWNIDGVSYSLYSNGKRFFLGKVRPGRGLSMISTESKK